MKKSTKPYLFQPGESELRWTGDTATFFLASGALTGGQFALVEERSVYGISIPLHKHDDVESFYILEGEVSFFLGDQPAMRGVAGTFVHIPGGTKHGFRIETDVARYLILTTPHHGEFYRAISSLTPHAIITDAVIAQACEQYGVELIGDLPS